MQQSIASLSPEQAQHALMIFYDLLPDEFWDGGKKPSAAKIKYTAEQLQEEAPQDLQPVVSALLAEGGDEGKGEAAKTVLQMFYERDSMRDLVDQATEQARQPHMAPIPLIIGAVIVILAVIPKEIKWKGGHYQGHDPSRLVESLATFVGKLPKEAWKALSGIPTEPGGEKT